jgi:hypothetical protein
MILELESIVLVLPPCGCCLHPNTSPSKLGPCIDLALPIDTQGCMLNEAQTFYPSLQKPIFQFSKFYLVWQSLPAIKVIDNDCIISLQLYNHIV